MNTKIDTLLQQLTLAEKASLLAGGDMWHTVPVPRLGIPALQVSDGPNGVRGADDNLGERSVCFPCGSALGATWNRELVTRVGQALAVQALAKGARVLLAPTVNMPRTPLAGRNFECFAEDPFLSGVIAAAYIDGLQRSGVAACIKHFVANDQETERFSISSEVAPRPLHEIYLEPFRIAIERANPWSLMSAYNRVHGTHVSESDALLRDVLKESWGYDGLVLSDWYGTYSDQVPAGGLDLEMPGPARWMDPKKVAAAVEAGTLDEAIVDDKVRRLLRLMARVGLLGDGEADAPPAAAEADLPRTAAAAAVVLLKNEGDLLPMDPQRPQTIAVIGENARWAQIMGGGSAQVNPLREVSPLAGIRARVGPDVAVPYTIGAPIHRMPALVENSWLTAADGHSEGLTLDYFHNLNLEGEPVHSGIALKSQISWFGTVNPYVDPTNFSLRLRGTLTSPESGEHQFHLWSIGLARLFIDGKLIVENEVAEVLSREPEKAGRHSMVTVPLEAGRPVSVLIEYITDPSSRWRTLRLGCIPPLPADPLQAAVDLAAKADVAIVVAGLTREWESEGFDRIDLDLPGQQNELISRVAAANPRTIVVLNAGAPVTMPWVDEVPAVVQQWYGGQDAGHALADVLFGDVNPSGRLPITFPQRLADNPAHINFPGETGHVHYGEGIFVGYRYYDKKEIEPLFPFGHGLSYADFGYANLRLNGERFAPGEEIQVEVDVTNNGTRPADEVVQLYVGQKAPRLVRPPQELKGFARVTLQPGETKTVALSLTDQAVSFYDPQVNAWVNESATFVVRVGRSSRDIRLEADFTWDSGTVSEDTHDEDQMSTVAT